MFIAPSHSYVMPLVKCSSRTVKSKDTLNQCCFQCNASSNMNQWHFFSCPAKFPIKISCFFSLEMQLSWSAYSPVPKVMSYLIVVIVNPNAHTNIQQCHCFRNCYCPCRIAIQIRNMVLFISCMFHHLLVTLLSTFFVQTEIYISRSILVELHK